MKKFKYLYFSNIISSSPLYKLWLFKKIKGGEEDDGNLLTKPSNYSYQGIDWTWNGYTVHGEGQAQASGSRMTETLELKKPLEKGKTYKFSIKERPKKNVTLRLITADESALSIRIAPSDDYRQFTPNDDYVTFYIQYACSKNESVDVTIEDFKLEEVVI